MIRATAGRRNHILCLSEGEREREGIEGGVGETSEEEGLKSDGRATRRWQLYNFPNSHRA